MNQQAGQTPLHTTPKPKSKSKSKGASTKSKTVMIVLMLSIVAFTSWTVQPILHTTHSLTLNRPQPKISLPIPELKNPAPASTHKPQSLPNTKPQPPTSKPIPAPPLPAKAPKSEAE